MAKKRKISSNKDKKSRKGVGGRPTKYYKALCQMIIDYMSQGYSVEAFAGSIDVNQDTIHEWAKRHREFSEAKKAAFLKCRIFWETKGIEGLHTIKEYDEEGNLKSTQSMNSPVWIFNMKNRFGWRDRQDITSDDKPMGGIKITMPDNGYGPKPGEEA